MRLPISGFADLSPRRRRILMQIVPSVVPSHYGQPAFRQIDAGWSPGAGYTTCGGLPALVATRLGVSIPMRVEGMGGGGLLSMRNAALKRGAWVHACQQGGAPHGKAIAALPGTVPKPGDLYMLCSGPGHEHGCCLPQRATDNDPWPAVLGAKIEHVGVIIDAGGSTAWQTADAGQGGSQFQMALYMQRNYSRASGYMTGEATLTGRPMRRLCGWVDVDRYPFLDGWGLGRA